MADGNPERESADQLTPAAFHGTLSGAEAELWDWILPRLRDWAAITLKRYRVADAEAIADDVVQETYVRVSRNWAENNWTFDPGGAGLRAYFRQIVYSVVMDELRRRGRRPGDYGAAPGDADRIHGLEKDVRELSLDIDGWFRGREEAARLAVEKIREEFAPIEYEMFYLWQVKGGGKEFTAEQVAEMVTRRFEPDAPVRPNAVHQTRYKIHRRMREILAEIGIDRDNTSETKLLVMEQMFEHMRRHSNRGER